MAQAPSLPRPDSSGRSFGGASGQARLAALRSRGGRLSLSVARFLSGSESAETSLGTAGTSVCATLLLVFVVVGAAAAQDAEKLSEAARQHASEKRFDEAEKLWRRAIAGSPNYFPALFNLGFMYYSQQRFADAEPVLRKAVRANTADFNGHYVLGATLSRLGKGEEALKEWRAALKIQPSNLRLMQIMTVEYTKGRYYNEAARMGAQVLALKSDDPNVYFLAIKAYQDAGDHEAALGVAARAVEKFPDSARAHFEYGFELQKAGRVGPALQHLKKAMAADPAYEEPFFFYGDLLVKQSKNEEAIPYLRTAIRNRNDYVPARVILAKALMELQNWEEAIKELEETIKLDPKHPQPHLFLSQIYFRLGDEERARKEKEISLRCRRENPTILEAVQGRPFPE